MAEIIKAGDSGSLGDIDTTQGSFREQIDALTNAVRQLGGNPDVTATSSDPLNAPFQLYVNPYIGSDKFVAGSYRNTPDSTFEDKMRRIELQRLECGYTEARPFKTLSRAILEAGIITSKAYLNLSPAPCGDLVSIMLAPGTHTVFNDEGETEDKVTAWADGTDPTDAQLKAFNDETTGGLILPRGCSVISLDLRKCIIRPNYVPDPATGEGVNYANRRSVFKCTGGGYYFGFTVLDKEGFNQSHHLLHVFEHTSKAELDNFYLKIRNAFGSVAGLDSGYADSRTSEYQIVGQLPLNPIPATDTVQSASPYIYNCSIRSVWGMGGIFADGSKVGGFRSMVVAQLTSVSLQRDMRAWEKWTTDGSTGSWDPFTNSINDADQTYAYTAYINEDPNNVRSRPDWYSFHIRAINKAILQEVSVFAIGQSIHHATESGGELTVTNSNSNFGGVAALAQGFRDEAQVFDKNWSVNSIRRPLDPLTKEQKVERIQLGILKAYSSTKITLENSLDPGIIDPNQPLLLTDQGYSLKKDDYVWIDNPAGQDYRAKINGSNPWNGSDAITITGGLTPTPVDDPNLDATLPDPVGFRVYIQRVKDVRSVEERRYSFLLGGGANNRLPLRDYVAQASSGSDWTKQYCAITGSEVDESISNGSRVELRASKRPKTDSGKKYYEYVPANFYRKGDVIVRNAKHYAALRDTTGTFASSFWEETFVHMTEDFLPEGNTANSTPIIIFDKDTSGDYLDNNGNVIAGNETLFENLGNQTSDSEVQAQVTSAVDYQGAYWQLRNWGQSDAQAEAYLNLEDEANRDDDLTGKSWTVEFRRPSNIRLYSHAFEWAGFHNYTKGMPDYQKTLLPQNKFTFYFTNSAGGKVYASGFNEEGFQVTPRGIEDLATGEVLSVDDLGNPDRPIDVPTEFKDLSVSGTLTLSNNPSSVVGFPNSKINAKGWERKASVEEVDETSSGVGIDNGKIDNSPMITLAALNYWKDVKGIITASDVKTIIYVDPVLGNDHNAKELIESPPYSKSTRAKSLIETAKFINATFSSNEKIELRIGAGYYLEVGEATIECRCDVRAWDFEANGGKGAYLNSNEDQGTKPFMGVDQVGGERGKKWEQTRTYLTEVNSIAIPGTSPVEYVERPNHPIFPCIPQCTWGYSPGRMFYRFRTLNFVFEQYATIAGVVWLGGAECLINSNIPDSMFKLAYPESGSYSVASIRAECKAESNIKRVLGYLPTAEFYKRKEIDSSCTWDFLTGDQCIELQMGGIVENCAFEAIVPCPVYNNGPRQEGVITTSRLKTTYAGLWLIGNAFIIDDVYNGQQMPAFRTKTGWEMSGHHETLICGRSFDDDAEGINISLGGSRESVGGSGTNADYNYTWNNIHLVGRNMQYRDNWNPTAPAEASGALLTEDMKTIDDPNKLGPAFAGVISAVEEVAQHGFFWHDAYQISDNHSQGVAGIFSNWCSFDNTTSKTRGMQQLLSGFRGVNWRLSYFLQQAGSDRHPDVSTGQSPNPGVAMPLEDFNPLNCQLYPVKKGIDVVEARTVSRDVKI